MRERGHVRVFIYVRFLLMCAQMTRTSLQNLLSLTLFLVFACALGFQPIEFISSLREHNHGTIHNPVCPLHSHTDPRAT